MTEEEILALKAEKEALLNKNKELLSELKTARTKNKEIDIDAYYKTLDELDSLKSENSKLSNELNKKSKEFDGLSNTLLEKDNYLKNLTLENSLNDHLTKAGVKPEFMNAAKALLKNQASVSDNNVLIGDKNIADYMTEWSASDGKVFIAAPANNGGGATGSNGTANVTGNLSGSKAEQEAYIKQKFNL